MKALTLMHVAILSLVQRGEVVPIKHMSEPVSHVVAESHCKTSSSFLIDDSISDEILQQYMERNGLKSVWLGIKRKILKDWTWTDGEKLSSSMPGGNHGCGGVSTVAGSFRAMACNYGGDHEGVVCENDYGCSRHIASEKCFQEGGQWFAFTCGVSNWYKAKDICNDLNSTIAKLNTTKKINALVNAKTKVSSLVLCGFFWIGVSREEWYTARSGAKSGVNRTRWDHGEPVVGKDCAIASLVEDRIIWSAMDCTHQYIAVCMEYTTPSSPVRGNNGLTSATNGFDKTHHNSQTAKPSDVNTEPKVPLWLSLVIAATGITVTAMSAGCIVYCIRRRKKNKSTSKSEEETDWTNGDRFHDIRRNIGDLQGKIAAARKYQDPGQGNERNFLLSAENEDATVPSRAMSPSTDKKESKEEHVLPAANKQKSSPFSTKLPSNNKWSAPVASDTDPALAHQTSEHHPEEGSAPVAVDKEPALIDSSLASLPPEKGSAPGDLEVTPDRHSSTTLPLEHETAPVALDKELTLTDPSFAPLAKGHETEDKSDPNREEVSSISPTQSSIKKDLPMSYSSGRDISIKQMEKEKQELENKTCNKKVVDNLRKVIATVEGSIRTNIIFKDRSLYTLYSGSITPLRKQDDQKGHTFQDSGLLETIFDPEVKPFSLLDKQPPKCDILVMDVPGLSAGSFLRRNTSVFKDTCVLMPVERLSHEKFDHVISVASVESKKNGDIILDKGAEILERIVPSSLRPNKYDDATWCAAVVVALFLQTAGARGFSEDQIRPLKRSTNIRKILWEMSAKQDEEKASNVRILKPEKLITDWENVKSIIIRLIEKGGA